MDVKISLGQKHTSMRKGKQAKKEIPVTAAGNSLGGTFRLILVKHVETAMYKNKMYVMDADCLRNGSIFCRFAGKVKTKMKNESITGFCGKCATRTDADAVQTAPAVPNGHAFLFQLNKGIG